MDRREFVKTGLAAVPALVSLPKLFTEDAGFHVYTFELKMRYWLTVEETGMRDAADVIDGVPVQIVDASNVEDEDWGGDRVGVVRNPCLMTFGCGLRSRLSFDLVSEDGLPGSEDDYDAFLRVSRGDWLGEVEADRWGMAASRVVIERISKIHSIALYRKDSR